MDSLLTVSIANNDETIKYNPDISYRLVGLVPNFNRAAAEDMSQSDATFRRKEITHSCMKVLLERLKPILDTKSTFLFADGKYRVAMPFLHFLNLDGKEIADHVLGSCTQCHLCDVKRKDLDRTDLPFTFRSSKQVSILNRQILLEFVSQYEIVYLRSFHLRS